MPAVVRQLYPAVVAPAPKPVAPREIDPYRNLTEKQRMEADRCLAILRPAIAMIHRGHARSFSAKWLASTAEGLPSWQTLDRWLEIYQSGGPVALASSYTGRVRRDYGWEARAVELYNQPQKPAYATVALWLRQEGHESASEHNVRRYLKKVPSSVAETGKKRLGAHFYAQNVKPHVVRDRTVLPVGLIYEGDGHCCDVYVQHPATGKAFRPELTVWIDVASRYVVGWWISEAESAQTTLFSISEAIVRHNNVPGYLHTDPGSGFIARMISDEVTGYLARLHIQPITALPGNARGKGDVEGWFRWFEERCGKRFETFCGHDRSDDFLRHLSVKVQRGLITLPTLAQYIDAIRDYVAFYNQAHQDNLGSSPAMKWAELQNVPLELAAAAIIRPREQRTVQRWGVRLDNRLYRHADLQHYEGRSVIVEYSIHDDQHVAILDGAGRLICDAQLVEKKAWLPESRIEEAQQRRLQGQIERHQRHIAEQQARARLPVSAAAALDALDAHFQAVPEPQQAEPLEQQHSLHVPTPQTPRVPRAPAAVDLALVREVIAEDAAPRTEETPEQRYTRWLDLKAKHLAGHSLDAHTTHWLGAYAESDECQSLTDLHDHFGYLPGTR